MERRREPYVQKLHPFSGQGQRLGELVPNFIGAGVVGQKVGRDAEQANIAVPGKLLRFIFDFEKW